MSEDAIAAARAQGTRPLWASQSWLQSDALDALAAVNEQCLELLCEQASARAPSRPRPALLKELEALWYGLDAGARRRAARCPFLLVDAELARVSRRPWLAAYGIRDQEWSALPAPFFTVPRTVTVTRLVLTYAWHLACGEPAAARLFLGMSVQLAERLAARTLPEVFQLAESEPGLLRPRWPDRVAVWRDLLAAAKGGEPAALERCRIRGVQLLAAAASRSD
ncbi:MAG: hypothetical protein ACREUT_01540 [Steroidobacteraceae bacterium]